MKEEIKKHNEHVLRTCKQEQARFGTRERQVRSNQRIRTKGVQVETAKKRLIFYYLQLTLSAKNHAAQVLAIHKALLAQVAI